MKSIDEVEDQILEYLEGELSAEDTAALLEAVAANPEYQALLDSYTAQDRSLAAYFDRRGEELTASELPDLSELPTAAAKVVPVTPRPARRWLAVAAAIAVTVGLAGLPVLTMRNTGEVGQVSAIEGTAQLLTDGGVAPLGSKADLHTRDGRVKTGRDSRLELALAHDAGRLEMNSNSLVRFEGGRGVSRLALERGEVLVEAQPGTKRPVRIDTPQFEVETTNGVVSVVRGLRGSEVQVLSGQAEVVQAGLRKRLLPGDAFSSEGTSTVPMVQRVSWSRTGSAIAATFPAASATTAMSLAHLSPYGARVAVTTDYLPEGTLAILEAPSLERLLEPLGVASIDGLLEPGVLDKILSEMPSDQLNDQQVAQLRAGIQLLAQDPDIRTLARSLNRAVSIGFQNGGVVLIADVSSQGDAVEEAFRERIEPVLQSLSVDGELPLGIAVANGFLALGLRGEAFDRTAEALRAGSPTDFAYSPFLLEVRNTSPESKVTAALNVGEVTDEIIAAEASPDYVSKMLDRFGLGNMQSVIAATDFGDQARNQALRVSFDGERQGVAGWLDEPGPLGSLRFFSPDAHAFVALRVQSPAAMLEQVFGWLAQDNVSLPVPRTGPELALLEKTARALGNEVAVGLDNPVLPVPHVKVAFEVVDPIAFHDSMLELLDMLARDDSPASKVTARSETYRDRLVVTFEYPGAPVALSYAIVDDYVVFGPGPAFVKGTIDGALDGRSLDREYAFIQSLPAKSGSHVSALYYQSVNESAREILPYLKNVLPPQASEGIERAMAQHGAGAVVAYAEAQDNRIDFFVEGVRVGEYRMANLLPAVAEWYQNETSH